ncbi:transcriptional regulator, partial [Bacteroides salyersiae]
ATASLHPSLVDSIEKKEGFDE